MKKIFYLIPLAALALAGCSSDEFDGTVESTSSKLKTIDFGSMKSNMTRATTGKTAADLLGGKFYVYGTKTNGTTVTPIFDNYLVEWADGSAGSTESNTNGWEYVGKTSRNNVEQDVKYWDYTAKQYDYVAVSGLADGEMITNAKDGFKVAVTPTNMSSIYFADRVTATPEGADATGTEPAKQAFGNTVTFNFRRLNSQMRIGFYETIPGYAVCNMKFYYATAAGGSGTVGVGCDFPVSGTVDVTYDDMNVAHSAFETTGYTHQYYQTFGKLAYTKAKSKSKTAGQEYIKADGTLDATGDANFLGTAANNPTWAMESGATNAWKAILPYETNIKVLQLRCNYQLVALDGSKETIYVRDACVTVPLDKVQWKPNYSYTYLFKISDNSNGQTGGGNDPDIDPDPEHPDPTPEIVDPNDPTNPTPDPENDPSSPVTPPTDPTDPTKPDPTNPAGLYPITFDAVVVESSENTQETISTIATPSITTYAKGSAVVDNDEYKVGEVIELSCGNATAQSWYVCNFGTTAITEKEAAAKDAKGEITFTGVQTGTTATYTPSAAGYYIFKMQYEDSKYAYKVVKVNEK